MLFPPDPGAAEQSHLGENIAANAGGPHAFKYGVTGAWVTGLCAVLPSGEVIEVGGPEAAAPVAAVYHEVATDCAALRGVVEAGLVPAALEYLDASSVAAAAEAPSGRC